jgi:hypothetical protein
MDSAITEGAIVTETEIRFMRAHEGHLGFLVIVAMKHPETGAPSVERRYRCETCDVEVKAEVAA